MLKEQEKLNYQKVEKSKQEVCVERDVSVHETEILDVAEEKDTLKVLNFVER